MIENKINKKLKIIYRTCSFIKLYWVFCESFENTYSILQQDLFFESAGVILARRQSSIPYDC